MNALKSTSIECISNDELMLKELERRDGIYSFIFHELESPKHNNKSTTTSHTSTSTLDENSNRIQLKRYSSAEEDDEFESEEQQLELEQQLTQQTSCLPRIVAPIASIGEQHPQLPAPIATRAIQPHHFQEYLKPWNPPPSLLFDHPQLYAYMANCGFRVRVPPPRFSHLTAPLVRNRRHALKESPEYKRCGVCLMKIPDLRPLFPCDPDVHAPFVHGPQNKMTTTTHNACNKY